MIKLLTYKGYTGTVEYTVEDGVLFGEVLGIRGLLSYEGVNMAALEQDFRGVIDDYLEMCEDKGYEPQKPSTVVDNVPLSA